VQGEDVLRKETHAFPPSEGLQLNALPRSPEGKGGGLQPPTPFTHGSDENPNRTQSCIKLKYINKKHNNNKILVTQIFFYNSSNTTTTTTTTTTKPNQTKTKTKTKSKTIQNI
jgi:hypothetical protein